MVKEKRGEGMRYVQVLRTIVAVEKWWSGVRDSSSRLRFVG